MRQSVSELISDRSGSMSASERRAAQTLVASYPLAGLKTVAEFSQAAGVSPPTILRFVARLGFQNYPEFQAALQDELAAQLQSPATRAGRKPPVRQGALPVTVEATVANLGETFRHLSARQIADIVELLAQPKAGIFLVGGRFTDPIAAYMAAHLSIIRSNVLHLPGQEGNWRDRLIDMGKRDVLLIFDIRRYQESLLAFAEKAHRRGIHIILFTDQWLSPIARFARHVVAGRTEVPSPWDSSASLFVVAEMLIGELTARTGEDGQRRIRAMEDLR
ncbi:MAG: MurR/RpiR family transcriptional regulator [Mesorhizobium sp.]|nr:MurR/RpiR family transcriptional regulator [Mesorhizobium sp.]MBL8579140.1 MurR/RpiR family transcriptional regulator [Mesorhizobium sp.]